MRRLALLLSAVCFLLTATAAFGQQPSPGDADGDTTEDAQDACPNEPGPPGSPTFGCPGGKDTDGDGTPDYADHCPTGRETFVNRPGCPKDDDTDGVPNDQDDCPLERGAPGEPNGCPLPRFLILGEHNDISKLARDPAGFASAQCYYTRRDLCTFHVTLTLAAASARQLGLKQREIGEAKVTTNKYLRENNLRYVRFKWGLSSRVKRALKRAKSVTLTIASTYARGSRDPEDFKSVTFTATRNPKGKPPALDTRPRSAPTGPDF